MEQFPPPCFPREGVPVEIESEWTARDRELKMFGGPPGPSSAQVNVQKTDVNPSTGSGQALGHQAQLYS